jgi:hypothetical protein
MTTKATSLLLNVAYRWEEVYATAAFSGIVGDLAHTLTGGYHISIEDQSPTNYSVVRPDDKAPPGSWSRIHATALDMSMGKADMILSTRRWMVVWSDRTDPRRKYFNAFNGWTGSGNAQRWDFVANTVQTSTNDHQTHQHTEIRRRYWNDPVAHQAAISIARGETKHQWMMKGCIDMMFLQVKGETKVYGSNLVNTRLMPEGVWDYCNYLIETVGVPFFKGIPDMAALLKIGGPIAETGAGGGGGLVQHTHGVESQSVFVAGSVTGAAVASSE